MMKECNFKWKIEEDICFPPSSSEEVENPKKIMNKGVYCCLTGIHHSKCDGEENCILFQLYKEKEVKK